ncbi:MAG: sigma-54-dependent Fis family transcriptional regulator [bacterium]|nr:sigma-54-dependent Fis family transcriptional regulator [bacterium]
MKILLVEDEAPLRYIIKTQLEMKEYRVDEAADLKTAGRKLQKEEYDIIFLDLVLPDGNSITLLDKYPAKTASRTIIITANPTIPGVVEAIKKGAYNFLEKPIDPEVLYAQVDKIAEINRLKLENRIMAVEMVSDFTFDTIIYQSKEMEDMVTRAKILAGTNNTILIQGETGVGKEVLAHALHNHSQRKENVFLPLNCAAIPAELFESELFGYEKGAFTGAVSNYNGRFFQANGGTLFLDEIGELPLPIQSKLLRILDERRIFRLRSNEPVPIDVRLITATNRDLQQEIAAKQFRSDLYYRLRESSLVIPPLREREEDILPLFRYFLEIYSRLFKKEDLHISREAEQILVNHKWDGNVRELKNIVKNIIPFKTSDTIELEDLSPVIMGRADNPQNKLVKLEEMENRYILKVLKITGFNISRASGILGVARSRLYRKLNQLNLDEIQKTPEK